MTWPATTTKMAVARTSWTKVAPVRHETGKGPNHRRMAPVPSITTIDPATNTALSFWPGLNFPIRVTT